MLRFFFLLLIVSISLPATAASYYYSTRAKASQACQADNGTGNYSNGRCDEVSTPKYFKLINFANAQTYNRYYWAECAEGTTLNTTTNTCDSPPPDPCSTKSGTSAGWKKTWPSYDDYSSPGETINNDGCSATIDKMDCAESGATGEYACWGVAEYSGVIGSPDEIESSSCTGSADPACNQKPPIETSQQQTCTPNTNGSYTCTSTSGSTQYSSNECTVGSTGGATGYQCVKQDYVPGSSSATRDDVVTTTDNGDGTTTTTTTSTTNNTSCKAGDCTTTTTTTTNSTTKDGAGNTLSDTSTCTGPNCSKPVDETGTEEEESEEEGPTVTAGFESPDLLELDSDIPTYGEALETFIDKVQRIGFIEAARNINIPNGGGSCSVGDFQIFGSTVKVSTFCSTIPLVLGPLSYLFLALWGWIAIRIILSA